MVGRPTIARKIGYPELILPNDVRNDLYVNVYSAELSRLSKTADRNVEVVVEAVDESRAVLSDAISAGASAEMGREFSSVVYYQEGKPRWNEVIRMLAVGSETQAVSSSTDSTAASSILNRKEQR